jgi:hypothetical protein
VSITLNGDVPRILSLAEFQVIGDADAFDVPIGDLFNTPKRDINRIAFIQDGGRFSESTFSMVTFVEMPTKRISVSSVIFLFPHVARVYDFNDANSI